MIDRATRNGLKFEAAALAVIQPAPLAKRRDSLGEFIEIGGEKNRLFGLGYRRASRFFTTDRPFRHRSGGRRTVHRGPAAGPGREPQSRTTEHPPTTPH